MTMTRTPAVKTTRKVYLSLGSNLGDRDRALHLALMQLESHPSIEIRRTGKIMETKAVLVEEQPDFLNCIVEIETLLSPEDLLKLCKQTEIDLGRTQTFRYGPRIIDIDILVYENFNRNNKDLTLPHPGIYDREYLHNLFAEFDEDIDSLNSLSGIELIKPHRS